MPQRCAVRITCFHCSVESFIAREHEADLVVENFGGGAGKSIEAIVT